MGLLCVVFPVKGLSLAIIDSGLTKSGSCRSFIGYGLCLTIFHWLWFVPYNHLMPNTTVATYSVIMFAGNLPGFDCLRKFHVISSIWCNVRLGLSVMPHRRRTSPVMVLRRKRIFLPYIPCFHGRQFSIRLQDYLCLTVP